MQPESAAIIPHDLAAAAAQPANGWRRAGWMIALCWALLLAVFANDAADMFMLWWDNSTFNHVLLIPPIIGWLIWQRIDALQAVAPQGWWPPLLVFAGALLLWLLGYMAGLSIARQLALVVMLQASLLAIIGPRAGWGMAFPIFYMLFLVPIGEEIVPMLQTITAKLSMVFLAWSGIPAVIEGVFITTPTGYFEVAEACSGIKFLIAMIAYGALVCNLCFRSWKRRAAFMAVCLAVPVLANGVRAWGTMYIAHFSGIEFAKSWDHVFYGWVFFAVVLVVVMAIGWRYFDRRIDADFMDADAINAAPRLARLSRLGMGQGAAVGAVCAMVGAVVIWATAAAGLAAPMPKQVALPQVAGWTLAEGAKKIAWEPRMAGTNKLLRGSYVNAKGAQVDIVFGLFDKQEEGREAGSWGQGALVPESPWSWSEAGRAVPNGKAERLIAPGPVMREALTFYRSGDLTTGSNMQLKLRNIQDRFLWRARPTMALIVSAEQHGDANPRAEIDAFLAAAGPVDAWMDGIAVID